MQSGLEAKVTGQNDDTQLRLEPVLRHLAHELRQPLSGIESIAYYLDMVLGEDDPAISQHCGRLRRMVQHANWVLNDASLAVGLVAPRPAPFCLRTFFSALGARLARHEECTLELHMAEALPVILLPESAPRFFEHLMAFLRDVAAAVDPIVVFAAQEDRDVRLTIHAETGVDPGDLLRLIGDPSPAGGVRTFLRACGGSFDSSVDDGRITLSMLLPAGGEQI